MGYKQKVRIAVIDMNNGSPNQGMRGIMEILSIWELNQNIHVFSKVFDLRVKNEIPGTEYDIYISSGGPGSPLDSEGEEWENYFFNLLNELEAYNKHNADKKYVFLICHSFQLACRKYGLGEITKRKSTAFGIFPMTLTEDGENDLMYAGMPNPFYAVDSRDWQIIETDERPFANNEALSLAIEKERPHVDLERCIMSIRFSKEFAGTQFHPEADPAGMKLYLLEEEKRKAIITAHGEEKYIDMLNSLDNPDRILLTQSKILPNFLNDAIQSLKKQ